METLKTIARDQQASSPAYFSDPEKDRMLATVLELAEEICVLRDRLDTCMRLAQRGQVFSRDDVSQFEPEDALIEQRLADHTQFFEQVLRKFQTTKAKSND